MIAREQPLIKYAVDTNAIIDDFSHLRAYGLQLMNLFE